MIKREHYLEQIRGFYDSDLIKIIMGIRRSGKSIILEKAICFLMKFKKLKIGNLLVKL